MQSKPLSDKQHRSLTRHKKISASQVIAYPDGTFSVAPVRSPKPAVEVEQFSYATKEYWNGYKLKQYIKTIENEHVTVAQIVNAGVLNDDTYEGLAKAYSDTQDWGRYERLIEARSGAESQAGRLSLVTALNFHQGSPMRSRRGINGMKNRQRRSVRCSAWVLSKEFTKGRIGFYTVTLPNAAKGVSDDDRKWLNENWGGPDGCMKRLHQELQRELARRGLPQLYVSVAEFQEKRWRNHGQLALHQHILLPVSHHKMGAYDITADRLREIWANVLSGLLDHPVDTSAAVNVKKCTGPDQIAKYLSKYMSKGGQILSEIKAAGLADQIPSSWWSSSHELKQLVKAHTYTLTGDAAWQFIREMDRGEQLGLLTYHPVEIQNVDQDTGVVTHTTVGYAGWFESEQRRSEYLSSHGLDPNGGGSVSEFPLNNAFVKV